MNFLSGKKTLISGFGLMLLAVLQVVLGKLGYAEYGINFEQGIQMFLSGLGILGIGHKIQKK